MKRPGSWCETPRPPQPWCERPSPPAPWCESAESPVLNVLDRLLKAAKR
ncbi:hypothetical protein [Nonomuraea africana]|uniref:Uncharacterized protein n=1 Tax=Nonomuraea africana TaxID=46171 RepID=A0ABR9K9K9_9ACTN|nr:hypothetical protein [Nonomuraea africana]MBE1558692.1 hypothetical protein [Nonomuraea africana]